MNIDSTACDVLWQYPVKRAAFFGSAARGDMTDNSDIDMLVEFLPGRGGVDFEFFGLYVDLEEAFGCRIDLITYDALYNEAKPRFRDNVLREMRVIYERES
jgi:predicted nucleotidyltransferase